MSFYWTIQEVLIIGQIFSKQIVFLKHTQVSDVHRIGIGARKIIAFANVILYTLDEVTR